MHLQWVKETLRWWTSPLPRPLQGTHSRRKVQKALNINQRKSIIGRVLVREHTEDTFRGHQKISSILKVVYPGNPGCLWSQLQASTAISKMLGDKAVCSSSDRSKLEGLAEAYKNSTAWDTRRQTLSAMAGIASYKAISLFIPGITSYRYTMANLHHLQFGRAAPVPKKDAPRLRIDREQVDQF